ncbi:MAG TPA: HAMP domain-containing sensor histidine kinase, partial [Dissulfurispiraceae bacterium]
KKGMQIGTRELIPAFYDTISREAKGPLVSLSGDVEAILGHEHGLSEADRRTLRGAADAAKEVMTFIDDLLDLSRLEDGKLAVTSEEFHIGEILSGIEADARKLIGAKEIELLIDCHETLLNKLVSSDSYRLKQIIASLVGNAVRTTDTGTITVLVSEAIRDCVEFVEISVADTGRGYGPEALEEIFESYSDHVSVGFALAKKLTEKLGGRIEAESEEGKGSVFTLEIPVKAVIY